LAAQRTMRTRPNMETTDSAITTFPFIEENDWVPDSAEVQGCEPLVFPAVQEPRLAEPPFEGNVGVE
jgi:hypothetical protein